MSRSRKVGGTAVGAMMQDWNRAYLHTIYQNYFYHSVVVKEEQSRSSRWKPNNSHLQTPLNPKLGEQTVSSFLRFSDSDMDTAGTCHTGGQLGKYDK